MGGCRCCVVRGGHSGVVVSIVGVVEKIECFHPNHAAQPVAKFVRFLQTGVHSIDIASIQCIALGEIVARGGIKVVVGGVVIDGDAGAARRRWASRSGSEWDGGKGEGAGCAGGGAGGLRRSDRGGGGV